MGFAKKMAYRFKCVGGGAAHESEIKKCYIDTYKKGYSPIEIARVSGTKSAKYIYQTLVETGAIPAAKPGRQSKKVAIPDGLDAFLKIRGLSFAQWCACWRLEQEKVAADIEMLEGPATEAAKRDFPSYFKRVLGINVDSMELEPFKQEPFVVDFRWDGEETCFKATCRELGLVAPGEDYVSALKTLIGRRKDVTNMKRLNNLPVLECSKRLLAAGEIDMLDF